MSLKETVRNSTALSAAEKKTLVEVMDRKDVLGDIQKRLYNLQVKLAKIGLEKNKNRVKVNIRFSLKPLGMIESI